MKRREQSHHIELTHERLYTTAELYVEGKLVATTTLKPNATKTDAEDLVRQYYHLPSKPAKLRGDGE